MIWYLTISAVVSFIALMKVPSRLSALDNVASSFVLSIVLGYALWPLFVMAAFKR